MVIHSSRLQAPFLKAATKLVEIANRQLVSAAEGEVEVHVRAAFRRHASFEFDRDSAPFRADD